MIPPFPILFFGGALTVQADGDQETIAVRGAGGRASMEVAVFHCPARTADLVTSLREQLDRMLARKIERPTLSLTDSSAELLQTIVRLISEEEMSVERFIAGKKQYSN